MPKKSLYIPDAIESEIITARPYESYSGRVSFLLTAAGVMAAAAMPDEFSAAEIATVADALDGHAPQYDAGVEAVLQQAWFRVFQASDGRELSARLAGLPLPAQLAVFERVRRRKV